MVKGAHDRWPRVPKNRQLGPIVGDIAIGFMHAPPQVVVVIYGRTIGERARLVPRISLSFMSSKPYIADVTEGAAAVHWKSVLEVEGHGSGDRYSEGQNKPKKPRDGEIPEFERKRWTRHEEQPLRLSLVAMEPCCKVFLDIKDTEVVFAPRQRNPINQNTAHQKTTQIFTDVCRAARMALNR